VPPLQLIVKLTGKPAVTWPEGAPTIEQFSVPGDGFDPQVIIMLPLAVPSEVSVHASGKVTVLPWAEGIATGAINRKTSVALASRAPAWATNDRIMYYSLRAQKM
jgi:hypothetical protein